MIDIAKGRYWDLPWSLVSSCTRCSPGCQNCWSLAMEKRFHKGIEGKVVTHPDRLSIPMKRRKPTVYAIWNDLFHEAVPYSFITEVMKVIGRCQHHTFLILTKRPINMESYSRLLKHAAFPNIYWGLTVCNQAEADDPVFLQVPGKKFLSIEPMLGEMDISRYLRGDCAEICPEGNDCSECCAPRMKSMGPVQIDAVILGGETGPGARPTYPPWARSIRNQCQAAGVPFFFKSWGDYWKQEVKRMKYHEPWKGCPIGRNLDGRTHDELPWLTP